MGRIIPQDSLRGKRQFPANFQRKEINVRKPDQTRKRVVTRLADGH
jgi:hypothetical protein